jgi:transposase
MVMALLLPDPFALRVKDLCVTPEQVTIIAETRGSNAACPRCGCRSRRVHSRYGRVLSDLPWQGRPVRLRLQTRRFFCGNQGCSQRVFAERLPPQVADTHARKTGRMVQSLREIGFACGGEGGSRLANHLGMAASADVILRLVQCASSEPVPTPRVLGVDDWALRKGQRYGTILCDLERHRAVDLLPDRSAESFANWLRDHPGVEVISRDRGEYYRQGAAAGAPEATQVADRWHLMHNLRDALIRMLDRYPRDLSEAAQAAAEVGRPPPPEPQTAQQSPEAPPASCTQTRVQQASQASRTQRQGRYTQVVALHEQGVPMREIARRMGMHRGTVRKFVHAGEFPERAQRLSRKRIDPFVDYLHQRWDEGCRNAAELTKELAAQGFHGSYHMVRRYVLEWRTAAKGRQPSDSNQSVYKPIVKRPSANRVSWMLLENLADRQEEDQRLLDALWERRPELQEATDLAQEFCRLVRDRQAESLDEWMAKAHSRGMPRELGGFANGLKQDDAAVRAALSLEWSNAQVEGQVNRLKLIKRQMYGRAGFDLLRQRVLHSGQ